MWAHLRVSPAARRAPWVVRMLKWLQFVRLACVCKCQCVPVFSPSDGGSPVWDALRQLLLCGQQTDHAQQSRLRLQRGPMMLLRRGKVMLWVCGWFHYAILSPWPQSQLMDFCWNFFFTMIINSFILFLFPMLSLIIVFFLRSERSSSTLHTGAVLAFSQEVVINFFF